MEPRIQNAKTERKQAVLTESPLWSWVVSISRHVVPHSQPGWIALWLFMVFVVANAIVAALFFFFGGSFWLTLLYPVITFTALGGGIAAVVAVRGGDRGFLLILPLVILLAALAFVVAEVVAPHD